MIKNKIEKKESTKDYVHRKLNTEQFQPTQNPMGSHVIPKVKQIMWH